MNSRHRFMLLALAAVALASAPGCRCGSTPDDEAGTEPSTTETPTAEATGAPVALDGPCEGRFPDAVALVNCEPVMTRADLQAEINEMVERYERMPDREPTNANWRNERRRRMVRAAVQRTLLAQHVASLGVTISDDDVDERVRATLGHVYDNEGLFERFLESHGSTREKYLDDIRQELAIDSVLAEHGVLEPTEEDIQSFYDQNRERWREGERVRARAITVRVRSGAPDEQVAEAQARIDAIRQRVTDGGEDFEAVARNESESADRARGGDRGWIVRGRRQQLAEDGVEEALFAARVGSVTRPIRTQLGFQIYQVLDRRPEGIRDLDEVRDVLHEPLRRRNRDRLSRELENRLLETADVVYQESVWGLEDEADAPEAGAVGE